jgi:hypothetical protein
MIKIVNKQKRDYEIFRLGVVLCEVRTTFEPPNSMMMMMTMRLIR